MRLPRLPILALFCVIAAFVGASIADPFVESLSNAGVFGAGTYTDRSMVDVFPVLLMGAMGAVLWVIVQVRRVLAPAGPRPRWLVEAAPLLEARCVARLLPLVVLLQIATLFAMETLEQYAVYGHTLGPTIWLGGPAIFSLAAHTLIGIGAAFALAALLRRCSDSLLNVIRFIARLFSMLPRDAAPFARLVCEPRCTHVFSPTACRIGERAPPRSA